MSTDRRNRNFALNLTKEQNQKLADFIFNKLKGEVDLPHSTLNSDDVDFVIKKRTITKMTIVYAAVVFASVIATARILNNLRLDSDAPKAARQARVRLKIREEGVLMKKVTCKTL